MIHRVLANCEDQFNAGEITATNLLDVASRIYGKALDKRVKEMKEKLIEDIESQTPELLEQAVQVEQENEEAVRQETENTEWHCEEEIVWDVMGMEERQKKWGIDPLKDVIICIICDNPTDDKLLINCGCQGGCRYCYEEALDTTGKCPHPECGQDFHQIFPVGEFKQKSREQVQAEKMSQEFNQMVRISPRKRNNLEVRRPSRREERTKGKTNGSNVYLRLPQTDKHSVIYFRSLTHDNEKCKHKDWKPSLNLFTPSGSRRSRSNSSNRHRGNLISDPGHKERRLPCTPPSGRGAAAMRRSPTMSYRSKSSSGNTTNDILQFEIIHLQIILNCGTPYAIFLTAAK